MQITERAVIVFSTNRGLLFLPEQSLRVDDPGYGSVAQQHQGQHLCKSLGF